MELIVGVELGMCQWDGMEPQVTTVLKMSAPENLDQLKDKMTKHF